MLRSKLRGKHENERGIVQPSSFKDIISTLNRKNISKTASTLFTE